MKRHTRLPLLVVAAALLGAPALEAQHARGGPDAPGGMMSLLDPLEVALEHRQELELTGEQVEAVQAAHAASMERTADARERAQPLVEQMQERMRQMQGMRGQRGQGMQGQRGQGMRGEQSRGEGSPMMGRMMDEETHEAVQVLREEYGANMEFLETRLTDEQVRALRELMRPERPDPRTR